MDVIYLVDNFGALYSEEIHTLASKYLRYAGAADKKVGIHTHNNQQLAYANTIEALILGASYLDATMAGRGRGAGNCPLELLLGFLRNPRFNLRPVLEAIEKYMLPLSREVEWGFNIPYMITGQLNTHPRAAIKVRGTDAKDKYVEFYDQMVEEES